jgi:hypothetical protein
MHICYTIQGIDIADIGSSYILPSGHAPDTRTNFHEPTSHA